MGPLSPLLALVEVEIVLALGPRKTVPDTGSAIAVDFVLLEPVSFAVEPASIVDKPIRYQGLCRKKARRLRGVEEEDYKMRLPKYLEEEVGVGWGYLHYYSFVECLRVLGTMDLRNSFLEAQNRQSNALEGGMNNLEEGHA